jgi:predicted AAA+ superfamily ATPase
MIIHRKLEETVMGKIGTNKVILILGTRRVGKTYLINRVSERVTGKKLLLNAEDFDVQEVLKKRTVANYQRLINDTALLIIDEAQAIPEIGSILKLIIDSHPNLTIIATGSSSLDLVNTTGEPLTGRQYSYNLYPIAQLELGTNPISIQADLEERLILGSYPEIFQLKNRKEKEFYLRELIMSYLLKDILSYSGIRQSHKLMDLLRLIAYQIGSEVSYNEISNQLGINKVTVENYLDLLQKVFILFKLPSYSTNQRKEISKGVKWYYYDNGIRNAVINDFRPISTRNDIGMLWENYVISERVKFNAYNQTGSQLYFWRNYLQREIDLIEVKDNRIYAYEIKYGKESKVKIPLAFKTAYPDADFQKIDSDNYLDFIM